MEYVRLLHPRHFDRQHGEFKSLAFKVYDDGASVVQLACVVAAGSNICPHVRKFYPDVGGDPPVFWIFDEAILPKDCRLVQKRSDTGDDCHFNIVSTGSDNALNKALRKLLKTQPLETFRICNSGYDRPVTRADLCPDEPARPTETGGQQSK
jgi:hypothetical protein